MDKSKPMLLHIERVKFLLEGTVTSASDPDRLYTPRVILQASLLCTCNGSIMQNSVCKHLVDLVNSLPPEELRAWILDSQVIPDPITPDGG